MTTFDEREDTFERKFIHDENLRFQVFCRRNRLLAFWCAKTAGCTEKEAEDYSANFIIDHMQSSDKDIAQDVYTYLEATSFLQPIRVIRQHMALFDEQAEHFILENGLLPDFRTSIQ